MIRQGMAISLADKAGHIPAGCGHVINLCSVISLSKEDYVTIMDHLCELGITGGVTYDALILYAGKKTDVDRVVTLNEKDFRRVHPDFSDRLSGP